MSGLWRTKSVEQSIRDTDEPGHTLKRTLSAWDLTVFGVAVVIGAGIFTLTARVAATTAGPAVSIAFVIAAIACGLAAMCYADSPRPCRARWASSRCCTCWSPSC